MSPIDGSNLINAESLCASNHRCVDSTERKIGVPFHKIGYAKPVGWMHRLDIERTRGQVPEKPEFGLSPKAS